MRCPPVACTLLLGLTVAGGATAADLPIAPIGTGSKTCVPKRGASCKGITHHRINLAGRDLRGAKFHGANLRHADFRDADLRGARFDGAKLRGADFSGANLKGAYFGRPTTTRKGANQAQPAPSCYPNCPGADLGGANFYEADLTGANLTSTTLNSANLMNAQVAIPGTSANFTGAYWANTTCPDGAVTSTGC